MPVGYTASSRYGAEDRGGGGAGEAQYAGSVSSLSSHQPPPLRSSHQQPSATFSVRPLGSAHQPPSASSSSFPRSSSASALHHQPSPTKSSPSSSTRSLSDLDSTGPSFRIKGQHPPPVLPPSSLQPSPAPHQRRLSPSSSSSRSFLVSPSCLLIALLVLTCVVSGYKVGHLLLFPASSPRPSTAPEAFLVSFPVPAVAASSNDVQSAAAGSEGGGVGIVAASVLAGSELNIHKVLPNTPELEQAKDAIGAPQLLLIASASSSHPRPNTLPLVPERPKPAVLPYSMQAAAVPPPFPLSPPSSHHNEERLAPSAAVSATVRLPGTVTSVSSPLGHKRLSVLLSEEGQVGYSVDSGGVPVLLPAWTETAVNYRQCRFAKDGAGSAAVSWRVERGSSFWRPVPGMERRWYYAEYNRILLWCEAEHCRHCPLRVEMRVYDEGVAVRAFAQPSREDALQLAADANVEPEEKLYAVVESSLQLALPHDLFLQCWGNNQEEPYVKRECAAVLEPTMTPVTIQLFNHPKVEFSPSYRLEQRFISVLQADGPAFMRSMGRAIPQQPGKLEFSSKGQAHVQPQEGTLGTVWLDGVGVVTPTAWHVVLIANSAGELLEHSYIVPLLCPPPSPHLPNMVDTRWVGYGKSLRGRGFDNANAQQLTRELMQWAAAHSYQIVHFDAGWYGIETNRTETATRVYPAFSHIKMDVVGQHAKELGIRFTVYVNDLALRETEQLVPIYAAWGLHGVKFGFVNTLSPRAMRLLHERIIAFAAGNLFVNVHDLYRPKGLSRTWPHLVTQEGIRGEERKPSAEHHTILPWVRLVQGSADYTPRYLKGSGLLCTRTHQLALPLILFSPIQSLFWAEPAAAIMDGVRWYYPELILWSMAPTTWDDTRVLASEIGGFASVARRCGQEWFIGSISNTEATTLHLNISTLFLPLPGHPRSLLPPPAKGYLLHIYADAYSTTVAATPAGRNGIKVLPRMTFILPPALSSSLELTGEMEGMPEGGAETVEHMRQQAGRRREVWAAFDAQMREDKKHFLQKESDWEVMRTGVVAVEMAPSGGNVIYIQPWM